MALRTSDYLAITQPRIEKIAALPNEPNQEQRTIMEARSMPQQTRNEPEMVPAKLTQIILLDVEGTTAPISFVYEKLFPYARKNIRSYLMQHGDQPEIQNALVRLQEENLQDLKDGAPEFGRNEGDGKDIDSAVAYCLWLMDRDRKDNPIENSPGLYLEGCSGEPRAAKRGFPRCARMFCRLAQSGQANRNLFIGKRGCAKDGL